MSSLSDIRSAVSQQERINSQLHTELNALANGINNASNSWYNLTNYINGTLSNGISRVSNSHENAVRSYEVQCEIEKMYKLFKNIELANKKIRACKSKSYYEFANYRAVRKIVQAMLNNIETNFVSDATIAKAIEVNHLQLPDYWLTCALLSIMAWKNDDKELAQKSLERACKLDKKNASIFFYAFHIRIGKENVALQWFAQYISCARTGEDQQNIMLMFSILNKTILEDCSSKLVAEVDKFVNQLIKEDIERSGYSEEDILNRITSYLGDFHDNTAVHYPLLSNYCKEINFLKAELLDAKTNVSLLDFILKIVNVTANEKSDFIAEYLDDLILRTNSSEKEIANEIKYNELIIACEGHVEQAKEEYEEWLAHNENEFTIVSEMIDWIYKKDSENVNPMVKKMMFKLTKPLHQESIKRLVENYRSKFKRNFNIKINEYETNANFAKQSEELSKIEKFFSEKASSLIAMEKITSAFIFFGVGALGLVGSIFLKAPALLVVLLAGVVGGAAKIWMTNKNKQRIAENCQIESNNTKEIFKQLTQEFSEYEKEYQSYDKYYDDIIAEFDKL